ncbi:transposase [Mesorhizobium sp. M0976]|uniref:transposase n=1 Tax=unclassified Mesorhizobium TaxID=325217 RepID=UPI00333572CB
MVNLTDEDRAFIGLSGDHLHHTINHSQGEYVRHHTIHANSIEAVWALLKRQIVGIHHLGFAEAPEQGRERKGVAV